MVTGIVLVVVILSLAAIMAYVTRGYHYREALPTSRRANHARPIGYRRLDNYPDCIVAIYIDGTERFIDMRKVEEIARWWDERRFLKQRLEQPGWEQFRQVVFNQVITGYLKDGYLGLNTTMPVIG